MEQIQYTTQYESPLGTLTVACDGARITGLWIAGQKYFGSTLRGQGQCAELPVFAQAKQWLDAYFAGRKPDFLPPLAPEGSAFRQAVWARLLRIPYGSVTTYGEIAKELRASAQAVGGAVGHNPISILIPCHRVVGANGSLTGYAGGVEKKLQLLTLEGAPIQSLFIPVRGTAL